MPRLTMSILPTDPEARRQSTHSQVMPAGVVLLVDDDEAVRGYCQMVLELNGWRVLTADCAETACELAARNAGVIRLLITDVVMPGTNGRELADRLWKDRPDLKVLFLSGYHADQFIQAGVEAAELHFLSKPFAPNTLIEKLKEILADDAA